MNEGGAKRRKKRAGWWGGGRVHGFIIPLQTALLSDWQPSTPRYRVSAEGARNDWRDYRSPWLTNPLPHHLITTSSPPPPSLSIGSSGTGQFLLFPCSLFNAHPEARFVSHDCVVLQIMLNVLMEGKGRWRGIEHHGDVGKRRGGCTQTHAGHVHKHGYTPTHDACLTSTQSHFLHTGRNARTHTHTLKKTLPLFSMQGHHEGTEALKRDLEWILLF